MNIKLAILAVVFPTVIFSQDIIEPSILLRTGELKTYQKVSHFAGKFQGEKDGVKETFSNKEVSQAACGEMEDNTFQFEKQMIVLGLKILGSKGTVKPDGNHVYEVLLKDGDNFILSTHATGSSVSNISKVYYLVSDGNAQRIDGTTWLKKDFKKDLASKFTSCEDIHAKLVELAGQKGGSIKGYVVLEKLNKTYLETCPGF